MHLYKYKIFLESFVTSWLVLSGVVDAEARSILASVREMIEAILMNLSDILSFAVLPHNSTNKVQGAAFGFVDLFSIRFIRFIKKEAKTCG